MTEKDKSLLDRQKLGMENARKNSIENQALREKSRVAKEKANQCPVKHEHIKEQDRKRKANAGWIPSVTSLRTVMMSVCGLTYLV